MALSKMYLTTCRSPLGPFTLTSPKTPLLSLKHFSGHHNQLLAVIKFAILTILSTCWGVSLPNHQGLLVGRGRQCTEPPRTLCCFGVCPVFHCPVSRGPRNVPALFPPYIAGCTRRLRVTKRPYCHVRNISSRNLVCAGAVHSA
jgi:hypothetical protein